MTTLQEYLNNKYPTQQEKNQVKEIIIGDYSKDTIPYKQAKLLEGNQLNLTEYPNLEKVLINGYRLKSKLTELNLKGCVNLKELWFPNNQLFNLNFLNGLNSEVLIYLNIGDNNIISSLTPFSKFINLEGLYLNNNSFRGSLEPLRGIVKLWKLSINDTDLDSGLEYLPENVKEFYCWVDKRKDAKVQAIYNLFANERGKVETDYNGKIQNFFQKLKDYKQWRKLHFSEEEIKQWIKAGFKLSDYNYPQEWKKHNFTDQKVQEWVKAGAKPNDYKFVVWFRDTKKLGPDWITNYQADYQTLSERFKKYGLCSECSQPNTGEQWCQACNVYFLQENFGKWTSHNLQIDKFIQRYQLAATDKDKFLEWIPYEQFTDIEYLAEGGFGKVYKAGWTNGSIERRDIEIKQIYRHKKPIGKWSSEYNFSDDDTVIIKDNRWRRNSFSKIVLKSLDNSQANTDFLQETEKHKIIDDWFNNIVPCYGLSQDPDGNYLMVMQYMPERDLRNYLKNKNKELTLQDKLSQLLHIAQGLKDIHAKNLVHQDFHSGNILKGIEKTSCLITDLGLCKPANEVNQEDTIFGVMPYVAPEVLQGKPYTQKADIYSFGIVAYELLSGLPPYYDITHDYVLGARICTGLRPQFQIKIPQLLEDLIKRCWNANPDQRPTTNEIERTLRNWQEEIKENSDYYRHKTKDTGFKTQLQEAEEHNQTLPEEIKFPKYKIHKGAIYTSRCLPTKEITRLLQSSQQLSGALTINMTGFSDGSFANISLENQQRQEQITQIQEASKKPGFFGKFFEK